MWWWWWCYFQGSTLSKWSHPGYITSGIIVAKAQWCLSVLGPHSPPLACPDGYHATYVGTHPLWETLHTTKSLHQLTGPEGPHKTL